MILKMNFILFLNVRLTGISDLNVIRSNKTQDKSLGKILYKMAINI